MHIFEKKYFYLINVFEMWKLRQNISRNEESDIEKNPAYKKDIQNVGDLFVQMSEFINLPYGDISPYLTLDQSSVEKSIAEMEEDNDTVFYMLIYVFSNRFYTYPADVFAMSINKEGSGFKQMIKSKYESSNYASKINRAIEEEEDFMNMVVERSEIIMGFDSPHKEARQYFRSFFKLLKVLEDNPIGDTNFLNNFHGKFHG